MVSNAGHNVTPRSSSFVSLSHRVAEPIHTLVALPEFLKRSPVVVDAAMAAATPPAAGAVRAAFGADDDAMGTVDFHARKSRDE